MKMKYTYGIDSGECENVIEYINEIMAGNPREDHLLSVLKNYLEKKVREKQIHIIIHQPKRL